MDKPQLSTTNTHEEQSQILLTPMYKKVCTTKQPKNHFDCSRQNKWGGG